jgi:8-oxo-dGTP pyrophosphatase MutT (NUDIX family)
VVGAPGVEAVDNSIYDCTRRETFEESGLKVELGRVVYIREYFESENDTFHFELSLSSLSYSGELTIRHIQGNGPDEHFIKDVRWVHKDDVHKLVVYPEILKDAFWEDYARGYPEAKYLGRSSNQAHLALPADRDKIQAIQYFSVSVFSDQLTS